MKFLLKDGLVHIVDNHGFANNTIEGVVETPELSEEYNLEMSINNGPYQQVKDYLRIFEQDLKKTSLQIVFRATNKKKTVYYKSDVIPLTQAIILGGTLEQRYPEALRYLLKEHETLKKEMKLLEQKVAKNVSETSDFLKGTMVEVVDTFEEITKKGSLF